MKKVFSTNSDCIHAFAQRKQNIGRSASGNVYFEGDKLYSYGTHFILAEFITENIVLINDLRYSASTSKHQSIVIGALRQYDTIYKSSHDALQVINTLKRLIDKLAKARKPEKYMNEANALIQEHERAQKLYPYIDNMLITEPILKELFEFFGVNDTSLHLRIENYKAFLKNEKDKNTTKFKEAFYNFKPYEAFKNKANLGFDLLRVKGEYIQTSQNVNVPISQVKTLYNLMKIGVDIVGKDIDGYKIRAVNNNNVLIGCHVLKIDEIERALNYESKA